MARVPRREASALERMFVDEAVERLAVDARRLGRRGDVAVVPGQLAALRLAQLRGIDLDAPLGLSKVTLTR